LDPHITAKLILLLVLFVFSALFCSAEAAFFSLNPLHLHKMMEEKVPFYSFVYRLLEHPRKLLVTIIAGNESVNITISVLAASIFIRAFHENGQWLTILVTTPILLIFAEALPKTFAVVHPIPFSSLLSPGLTFISHILRPLVWVLEKMSDWVVSFYPRRKFAADNVLTEDEFKLLIDAGYKEGALEETQRDLIHRIFASNDEPVSELMVPRVEMFCLPISMGITGMEKEIIRVRHSKIPVYGKNRDDILGILFAKDFLDELLKGEKQVRMEKLLKKPYFVPLEKRVGSLLEEFQLRRMQMAVVVDEYGGISGLVTLEDVFRNLFGDVYGDSQVKGPLWQKVDDQTWIVSGRMPVEDVNELIDLSISAEDFDTVGGFVFHLFGKLPSKNDEVNYENYSFCVEEIRGARIDKIRIKIREGNNRE
jgi:CBS domain containing-hemolysin-like protein